MPVYDNCFPDAALTFSLGLTLFLYFYSFFLSLSLSLADYGTYQVKLALMALSASPSPHMKPPLRLLEITNTTSKGAAATKANADGRLHQRVK